MKRLNRSGMLLVEALLAVIILGVGIALVVQSLSASRRNVARSLDYTPAMFLIENKLTDRLLSSSGQSASSVDENLKAWGHEYIYSLKEESLSEKDPDHLKNVKVGLSWNSGRRENVVSINTLLFSLPEEKQN